MSTSLESYLPRMTTPRRNNAEAAKSIYYPRPFHTVIFFFLRHTAAKIPSFQVTSHLQQKAIRNQKAYHLLGCCLHAQTLGSSLRNHPNNPVIGMFTDSSFLCFPITLPTQCSSTNPLSSKCTDWLVQPAPYSFC
jgi:hypothetical protein